MAERDAKIEAQDKAIVELTLALDVSLHQSDELSVAYDGWHHHERVPRGRRRGWLGGLRR